MGAVMRESLGNPIYRRAVESNLAGLTAVSTGTCPGCRDCAARHGYFGLGDEGPEIRRAMAQFEIDWRDGKIEDHAEFSSDMCQICSTHLHGDRAVFHWIDVGDPAREIRHGDSCCSDCVAYLVNGDEPEINRAHLPAFVRGYLETILWSSTDESREDGGDLFDCNYSIDDFAEEALALAVRDCLAFADRMSVYLTGSGAWNAGHDFWLTRCGHGAGFWDGDWPADDAELLTDAAQVWGNLDPYVGDDGKIYLSGGEIPAGWIPVIPRANHDHDCAVAEFCARMGEVLGTARSEVSLAG